MATAKILDPTTTTTASHAFLHPLPQVRQFHRTLTTSLDEKNARLRTLVGGSYRQLLGTAELILEMRHDIELVEEKLGKVGSGCGRGVVGNMAKGLGELQGEIERGDGQTGKRRGEMEWAARVKGLSGCVLVMGRLLRRRANTGGEDQIRRTRNLLLAAKVSVLSRLLAKITENMAVSRNKGDREVVEELTKKLGGLRRKLRRAIEKTLERTDGDASREDLLLALSAYSLATSSGAKDVLRQFLKIRGNALECSFDEETHTEGQVPGVIRALELYTRTLLDVQAFVPRRFSETLATLKSEPLLKDVTIREIEGLRLDVYEKWFGDEILFFTPYIRHDDLGGALAVETLKTWAKKASEIMLQGFSQALKRVQDFKAVVDLRTKILQIWIKDGGRAKGFNPSVVLDGLRKVINERLVQLLESRIKKLHLVATEVEGTLGSCGESKADTHGSLWDESMLGMEISLGASLFKNAIIARTYGRNDAVSRVYKGYQTWRQLVDEIVGVIEQLKKQRWDDDLEDIEDDVTLESRNTLLSTDDPNMLQERLEKGLMRAYKDLHEKLASLLTSHEGSEDIPGMSIYMLRVIRDLRSELPKDKFLEEFGINIIPVLHESLASTVSTDLIEAYPGSFGKKKLAGRALWEGEPALPVLPSPATFKLLNDLTLAMAKNGGDLWSQTAIDTLKKHLRKELGKSWGVALKEQHQAEAETDSTSSSLSLDPTLSLTKEGESAKDADAEAPAPAPASPEPLPKADISSRKDILTQSLFDVLLLQNVVLSVQTEDDALEASSREMQKLAELDGAAVKRLQQGAKEYWRRTSLLFRLLA
ncbi:hypothetical protein BJ875DRAFT_458955 [Amylocarpus encephaloides]|uniref:Conserved oligomeric Golgi complex subunit 1 n=1 Tax=Amylocarpus encephaloides TaxID=45428 RepID=A0A9P8C7Y1_9HELO|nr:hypothetical protein BJ875DRAFT_458955 [Amylocarpus encephaloides]